MKKLFQYIFLTLICTSSCKVNDIGRSNSQNEIPVVQSNPAFKVILEEDIVYAKGLNHESVNSSAAAVMPLKLDVYVPDNNLKNRPAYMFIHGGGFAGGSKQQEKIKNLANYFTSRGWVFISIDYRLKKHKGTVPLQWKNYATNVPKNKIRQFLAIYPAIRDAKAALRWVIANSDRYNINTNFITVGGGSAGAVTSIALGISNNEDFRDEININQDPTLLNTNLEQSFQIRTIVDLWGSKIALYALEEIFGLDRFDSNDPSLFIAHGTEDTVVPFSRAEELKTVYEANKVPLAYYPLKGKGHGAWNATVYDKRLEELMFDFIVKQQNLTLE